MKKPTKQDILTVLGYLALATVFYLITKVLIHFGAFPQ